MVEQPGSNIIGRVKPVYTVTTASYVLGEIPKKDIDDKGIKNKDRLVIKENLFIVKQMSFHKRQPRKLIVLFYTDRQKGMITVTKPKRKAAREIVKVIAEEV